LLRVTLALAELDEQIDDAFQRHQHAKIILRKPAFGSLLGATFLAATGGRIDASDSADKSRHHGRSRPVAERLRTHQR